MDKKDTAEWEFQYKDEDFRVTSAMTNSFNKNGFVIIRGLLDPEEMTKVKMATESEDWIKERSFGIDDGTGRKIRACVWDHPGDDVLGMIARCPKVVHTMSELLDGEVYHYHSKLIMKDPHTGAAHVWHQDYGYWYQGGCLFPDMGSVSIALDKAFPENGCLQLLRGSHRAGRVEHIKIGGQFGADPQRVKYYQEIMEQINVEMEPGDAVFFHSNVLHTAPQNNSDSKRWVFIVGYNRRDNSPAFNSPHPTYNPIKMELNHSFFGVSNSISREIVVQPECALYNGVYYLQLPDFLDRLVENLCLQKQNIVSNIVSLTNDM